jgi:putative ABC transport system permease protein
VAFGTYVLGFAATYRTAERADAQAAIGSDLRLTPGDPSFTLPSLGPDVAAASAFRLVPARVGSDRKTILAIDPSTYGATVTTAPDIQSGGGLGELIKDPLGVLVANEIAADFSLHPGDTLPAIIFPDDFEANKSLGLHVIGVFRSFPPTAPVAELVVTTAAIPPSPVIPPPDFYLARVSPGRSAVAVAGRLRDGLSGRFGVATIAGPNRRGLTALNLGGLSRIESLGGGLIAAVGVAVLGAFLVLERRREFAILRAVGAERAQILSPPATEGLIAVFGSLGIGVPLGLGLGVLAVRILGLFFTLSPPLLSVPGISLGELIAFMIAASAIALGAALVAVNRVRAATVLRE